MKHKLPIGIQDFVNIRENGYLYVDKTKIIHALAEVHGIAYFLSRPRRFGKSLLCSTLEALFKGRYELFDEVSSCPALAITTLDWEWKKYPVIRLDLNAGNYLDGISVLYKIISIQLEICAKKYGADIDAKDPIFIQFFKLIEELNKKTGERVVIIIDEYDKPLLSLIDKPELFEQMRNALSGFYSVLKTSQHLTRFTFITGVTKFAQVSIFSDLNHLDDISMNPRFAGLCGITQEELELDFNTEIEKSVSTNGKNKQEYLERLRRFYNGYRFSEKELTVYNPFGILNHFNNGGKFESYWFATGTPTFLVKLITEQKIDILNLEKKQLIFMDIQNFHIDNMDALAVLYQSGYLTIVDYDDEFGGAYTLDYPNEEVRASFANSLLDMYIHSPPEELNLLAVTVPRALAIGDIDTAIIALKSFLKSIPYSIQIKAERYYQTVVHLIFRMLGLYCVSEVQTADGRIDSLVQVRDYVYCFEFKLDGSAEEALRQIDTKEYLLPWKGSGKKLVKVGVSFNTEKRNICEWKIVNA